MTCELAIDPQPLPAQARGLLLAFSGGLDSSVLLHRLCALPWARARGLRALHVDHGLHPESADWARHCARVCAGLEVPFESVRVQLPEGGGGLEERARRARYAALSERLGENEVLVSAHHLDDQAETFLLRALRGAGEQGLAGMRALRPLGRGWLWRPLLSTPRSVLQAYAQQRALRWIDDPSNALDAADRNFLRLKLLPLLRQRWPHAAQALAQSAAHSASAHARLAQVDAQDLAEAQLLDPRALDLRVLRRFEPLRRQRVLRAWLPRLGLPSPPPSVLLQIERELLHARRDSDAEARWHYADAPGQPRRALRLRAWNDALCLLPELPPLPAALDLRWDGSAPLALPDGQRLELCDGLGQAVCGQHLPWTLQVHTRQGGERIELGAGRPRQSLKHQLQALQLPPWQRAHLPLLHAEDGALLAAGDVLIGPRLQAALDALGLCLRWRGPLTDGLIEDLSPAERRIDPANLPSHTSRHVDP